MKTNIFFRFSQTIKLVLFLFTLFFFLPTTASAMTIAAGQPLGACKTGMLTYSCPTDVDCFDITNFKTYKFLKTDSDNMCLPKFDYSPCMKYDDGACNNGSGGTDQCVTISSIKDPSFYGVACLSKNLVPQEKTSIDIDCSTCGVHQQCVYVIPNNTSSWPRKRCIYKDALPPAVMEGTGTCQTNAACLSDEMCIYNTFEPQKYGFSCVKKIHITESPTCPTSVENELDNVKAGISCGATADEKKFCMYAIPGYKGPKPFTVGYRCVDIGKVAGGLNSPSVETCKSDADCKIKSPTEPFCISNPTTKKNQCFSQSAIYTDMATALTATPKCGTGADAKDCKCPAAEIPKCAPDANAATSICATYIGDGKTPGQLVCINNGNLGTGGAQKTFQYEVAQQTYKMLSPKLQIDVPGLSFDNVDVNAADGPGGIKQYSVPYLSLYLAAIYKYAIGLGTLIAIIFVMYGGFRWMTSFGNGKAVSEARSMIGNAVMGLLLLIGAYSLLYIINPDLIKMEALEILTPKQEVFQMVESDEPDEDTPAVDASGAPVPGTTKKVRLCDSFASCQKLCTNGGVNISAMNSAIQASGLAPPNNLIDPRTALTQYLSNCSSAASGNKKFLDCGIIFRGDDKETKVLPSVIKGLADAAVIAKESGYILSVGSSYRSPEKQVAKVCTKMTKIPEGTKPCGSELACPGGSNHGNGFAIDVCLAKKDAPTTCLTPPTGSADSCANNTQKVLASTNLKILNDILFKAGWFKYCKELWHFEYTSTPVDGFRTKTY